MTFLDIALMGEKATPLLLTKNLIYGGNAMHPLMPPFTYSILRRTVISIHRKKTMGEPFMKCVTYI